MASTLLDHDLGTSLGLGTTATTDGSTPSVLIWALGGLGFIAVIAIILASFNWLFARSNDDTRQDAQRVIFAGLIGLGIVLIAWAVVSLTTRGLSVNETGPLSVQS